MDYILDRVTFSRDIMGGQACIRDTRVPVSLVVNMIANGLSFSEVLDEYQYLEKEDIRQALKYASWTVSDQRPQSIQNMMETIMPVIENCAEQGNAIFSVSDNKVRIRHLPIA